MMNSDNFVLLYSTLGYEKNGTKKAFVRTVDAIDENEISTDSTWMLLNENGKTVISDKLAYKGFTYGIQLWGFTFREVVEEGNYTFRVQIKNKEGAVIFEEESLPFQITEDLFTKNVLLPLTLYNAEARDAPDEPGHGFHDCNNCMAEAYSHGIFLNGLTQTYIRRYDLLSEDERTRFVNVINIAVDFLLLLHIGETGEFRHSPPGRYLEDINLGVHNTYEALYGLSCYLYYFKGKDPVRAGDETYEKAKKSLRYLLQPEFDSDRRFFSFANRENLIPTCYYLYKYAGDKEILEIGLSLMRKQLKNFNMRTTPRGHVIPWFEGMYLFMKEFPDHPEYEEWLCDLNRIKDTYHGTICGRNAFGYVLWSKPENTEEMWDDMSALPTGWLINTSHATNAIDACYIAELTGDNALEELAAGEINYIMGINSGIEGQYVDNPPSDKKLTVGAFIHNLNARYIRRWYYMDAKFNNNDWMSIMNGFRMEDGQYAFKNAVTDDWVYGELFIRHDGAFAHAFCVYEDYLKKMETK